MFDDTLFYTDYFLIPVRMPQMTETPSYGA